MNIFRKTVITAVLCLLSTAVLAKKDTVTFYKHELGLDIANIVSLLVTKKSESKLLIYKFHFNRKNALRTGLNVNWSTDKEEGFKTLGLALGYERKVPIKNKWQLHYGADLSYTYWARNFMPNYYMRYGISPVIGVSYYFTPQFSISTEVGVNFQCTSHRNPKYSLPADNRDVFEVNVGYAGMFVLRYHF